jgi:choline dehydrogenase-like flavoprotein
MGRADGPEYDVIIVGAGAAGCVLSARLTEDPEARVLLLEAGSAREPLAARIPVAYSKLFKSRHDWADHTQPEPALAGRRLYIPHGKLLGGSSAMNAMIYIRGNALDYAGWVEQGAAGWSYAEVLPFFLRAEDQARGPSPEHCVGGPLRVEDPRSINPLSQAFVAACSERGIPRNPDFNGPAQDGAGFYQLTQKGGRRWSAANAYLFPALARKNLSLARGARVSRVCMQGDRASAVEYTSNGRTHTAHTRGEIVLCAGAMGSAQLLLLSGVGPASELARLDIPVKADLPGVGANLQDHPFAGLAVSSTQAVSLRNAESLAAVLQYAFSRSGPLSSNVAEAGAFVRSPAARAAPDIQFHFAPVFFVEHGFVPMRGHGFSIGPTLIAPHSRGRVALGSKDPEAPPLIFGNHLSAPEDLAALRWGLELGRELAAAPAFDAYRGGEQRPGPHVVGAAAIEQYIRATTELLYHPCGTCRMGRDELSVVDPELRVRGIRNLRVADASVMPSITRGNTLAPTIMIAERLAAWLRREPRPAQQLEVRAG